MAACFVLIFCVCVVQSISGFRLGANRLARVAIVNAAKGPTSIKIANIPTNSVNDLPTTVDFDNQNDFSLFLTNTNSLGIRKLDACPEDHLVVSCRNIDTEAVYELIPKPKTQLDKLVGEVSKSNRFIKNRSVAFEEEAVRAVHRILFNKGQTRIRTLCSGQAIKSILTGLDHGDVDGFIESDQQSVLIEAKLHANINDIDFINDQMRLIDSADSVPNILPCHKQVQLVLATSLVRPEVLAAALKAGIWVVAPVDGTFQLMENNFSPSTNDIGQVMQNDHREDDASRGLDGMREVMQNDQASRDLDGMREVMQNDQASRGLDGMREVMQNDQASRGLDGMREVMQNDQANRGLDGMREVMQNDQLGDNVHGTDC